MAFECMSSSSENGTLHLQTGLLLFLRERLVQRAGTKALKVQGDISETKALEPLDHLRAERLGGQPADLGGRNLDAGDLAMMANAKFDKTRLSENRLRLVDLSEPLGGDLQPVADPTPGRATRACPRWAGRVAG